VRQGKPARVPVPVGESREEEEELLLMMLLVMPALGQDIDVVVVMPKVLQ